MVVRTKQSLLVAVLVVAMAGCSGGASSSGEDSASLRRDALAVGQAETVTLSLTCGIGPVVVGGQVFRTDTYPPPSELPEGWGNEKVGVLRRSSETTVRFLPEDSTIRIQFERTFVEPRPCP